MAEKYPAEENDLSSLFRFFRIILEPERSFYGLAIIYGIGISLLSLATPVSVQMLINTVANMGLTTPLVVLSLSLFFLLLLAGGLNALRIYILDVFGRRFYARMVSEISLRTIYARNPFFDDEGKSALFNRYFDIIIVMKMMPNLLVGGFTIILQTVVGFILVSSYHPLFLAFNATILALIWLSGRSGADGQSAAPWSCLTASTTARAGSSPWAMPTVSTRRSRTSPRRCDVPMK
jgi:ABC-type bacteriocin/lantibiotic exporter with double-glycine peptidase domain